jgi:hypothetical protein
MQNEMKEQNRIDQQIERYEKLFHTMRLRNRHRKIVPEKKESLEDNNTEIHEKQKTIISINSNIKIDNNINDDQVCIEVSSEISCDTLSDTVSEISYTSYNISSDSYESDDSKDISNCVPFIEKSCKSSSSSDDNIKINKVQINRDRKAYEMFTRKIRLMDIENQTKKSLSDLVDIYVKKN